MSALGEGVGRFFRAGASEGGSFAEQLGALVGRHGGNVTHAAKALGVARTTIQRWRSGKTSPKAATRGRVERANRDAVAPRLNPAAVQFVTTGNDHRSRTLNADDQVRLTPEAADEARAVWVRTGDKEQAAKALHKGIRDPVYKDYLAPDEDEEDGEYEHDSLDEAYCAASVLIR